jgi:hypothetical protein
MVLTNSDAWPELRASKAALRAKLLAFGIGPFREAARLTGKHEPHFRGNQEGATSSRGEGAD